MTWWIVVPVVFAAWFLFVILPAAPRAIESERKGIPEDERNDGVSVFPAFPLFPAIMTAIWAYSSAFFAAVIFWLHAFLLAFCFAMAVFYTAKLRRTRRERTAASAGPDSTVE